MSKNKDYSNLTLFFIILKFIKIYINNKIKNWILFTIKKLNNKKNI